jgi:hypothetical protein
MIEIRRKLLGLGHTVFAMVAAPVAALAQTPTTVKLYDAKRKREEQGVGLQARLSDALLLTPGLTSMPVVASVHMPLRRGSPPVVELKGTVPTPDAREIAVHVVQRELAGVNAQLEDQIVVDPQGVGKVAA